MKWQNLVSFVKKLSFFDALKQTLASLTASIFTPNRIGEYGAKVAYFEKQSRKQILILNLLGNMAQLAATISFGMFGFLIFLSTYEHNISSYKIVRAIVLLVMIFGFFMLVYKNDGIQIRGYSFKDILNYLKEIPKRIHIKNIVSSLVRYLIFSFQFYMLLNLFGIEITYMEAMVLITSYYLISSIIPTIFILDLVVKGSVALFFIGFTTQDHFSVLAVVMTMWILNFAIPSFIGSFYVLSYKFPKSNQTES